ncbi:hypothetical protein V492_03725 [Pseudogymnoascus sp. VKM F-4246]|nr:hypothetical protein V492_03725 [Pseudogymnoascus sp. VKM F-4246]
MAVSQSPNSTAIPKRVVLTSSQLPPWLRCAIWASQYVYPGRNRGGGNGNVVRLPFGRVLKMYTHRSEIEAMEYVHNHTSVPVPKVFEVYEQPDGAIHILMEFLPGDGPDYTNMTPDEIKTFGKELAGYLQQLRSLEPPEEGFIGSVSLGSSMDHRVGHIRFGPFHSVSDFHDYLRLGGPLESWEYDPVVKKIHSRPEPYKVKFTHADLNPTNVQYHNGKIQAIIDWEFAGWYPEYWEYTKMYFAEGPLYKPFFDAVVGEPGIEKYPEELQAEKDIRRIVSPWRYDDYYGKLLEDEERAQGGRNVHDNGSS